jgi:hypothetical protein
MQGSLGCRRLRSTGPHVHMPTIRRACDSSKSFTLHSYLTCIETQYQSTVIAEDDEKWKIICSMIHSI